MQNSIREGRIIRLLLSNTFLRAGRIVFQVFLNIFIWKQTQDIAQVALFNILYLGTHTLSFTLFAPIVKK